jgi:hypothetical protein
VTVYEIPSPPPVGARVADEAGRVWTRIDDDWNGSSWFHEREAKPSVVPIPWVALLQEYGPLTLVDDGPCLVLVKC